jgi:3-methyladenine DNA glycosylase AlkD
MADRKREVIVRVRGIIGEFRRLADRSVVEGMARFGIRGVKVYGIGMPALRLIASRIGMDHRLASMLWKDGSLEARVVAALIDDPEKVTGRQMEKWVSDFDNWAVCDQCCLNLFYKTPFAWSKAIEWCSREEEFVRRAGFAMIAVLAVHDREATDEMFIGLFPLIVRYSVDERNFVKKSVNWALRQIGKRNRELNHEAIRTAVKVRAVASPSAKWISADALRELKSASVRRRLLAREASTPGKRRITCR